MNSERWRQVEAFLKEALKVQPAYRSVLVRGIEDAWVRSRVESVLGVDINPGGIEEQATSAANAVTAEASTLPVFEAGEGVTIGPYRLLQRIGEGGMGEVWLAEQKDSISRRVALKLIKPGMNSRELVTRFESERQALALMDHPAIAKVFAAGSTTDGRPYFAMEYVPGISITEYCDKHCLTTHERLELFARVCEGVQHAHQKAIIHRDLKPSNILVNEVSGKATPRIIDFGVAKAIARSLSAETMFTRLGSVLGTPGYMSPEQADSAGEDVDTRTDIYSLGVILYELLSGTLPLDFRKLAFDEVLRRLREEDAPRPSTKVRTPGEQSTRIARNRGTQPETLSRQLRGDLDAITLKALEKDRARRYATPSEFADDISRFLSNQPVLARPPSLAYQAKKFAIRHTWPVAAVAAVLFVLIGGILSTSWQAHKAEQERLAVVTEENEAVARQLVAQASLLSQESPANDYLALLLGIESARRYPLFDSNLLLSKLLELDHETYQLDTPIGQMSGPPYIAFSPDGRFIAPAKGHTMKLTDIATRRELWRFQSVEPTRGGTVSSDGHTLWLLTTHGIKIVDISSGREVGHHFDFKDFTWIDLSADLTRALALSFGNDVWSARVFSTGSDRQLSQLPGADPLRFWAFSPDGRWVLEACGSKANGKSDYCLRMFNAQTGKQIWNTTHSALTSCVFSPDSRSFGITSSDGLAQIFATATGQEVARLIDERSIQGRVSAIDFSPDGRRIAAADNSQVQVFDANTRKEIVHFNDDRVSALTFSADGKWLAAGSRDGVTRVFEAATANEVSRCYMQDEVESVRFSPNGRWLAAGDGYGESRLLDSGIGTTIPDAPGDLAAGSTAFSPDGKLLAAAMWGNGFHIVQLSTGKDVLSLNLDSPARLCAFSPNQQKIAVTTGQTTRIFGVDSGKDICRFSLEGDANSLAFSPDNKWVAVGTSKATAVFDASSGNSVWMLNRDTSSLAYTPNGNGLAAANADGNVRVFDSATGKDIPGAARFSWVAESVAFSPDGRWMANSQFRNSGESSTRLIEVASGKEAWRIRHYDRVEVVTFSPDSHWLAIATAEGGERIFNLGARREISRVMHAGIPAAITFDAGSRYLLSAIILSESGVTVRASSRRQFRLYQELFQLDDLVQQACGRLPTNLSHSQWKQYLPHEPYRKTCPNLQTALQQK